MEIIFIACRLCLFQYFESQYGHGSRHGTCPHCRKACKASELITAPTASRFSIDVEGQWRSSAKVDALLAELSTLNGEKAVVFSQWTSFLDLLEVALRCDEKAPRDLRLCRLDGSLAQAQREKALHDFALPSPQGSNVMLISLKAGGVGLNLTSATRWYGHSQQRLQFCLRHLATHFPPLAHLPPRHAALSQPHPSTLPSTLYSHPRALHQ